MSESEITAEIIGELIGGLQHIRHVLEDGNLSAQSRVKVAAVMTEALLANRVILMRENHGPARHDVD